MFQETARALTTGALIAVAAATPSFADVKLRISGQHATDHPATIALNEIAETIGAANVGLVGQGVSRRTNLATTRWSMKT